MNNTSTFVAILTYNEESNILSCIDSILSCNYKNVFVFDGGSNDNTVDLVKGKWVNVEIFQKSSISERRAKALKCAVENNFEFILFVDADQRLLDTETQSKVNQLFIDDILLGGVQLNIVKPPKKINLNYWQQGFYSRHSLITNNFGKKAVIGTPCFFKVDVVKNFHYDIGKILGSSDDTFFCKQITSAGFSLKSTDIKCTEVVRASLKSTMKKAFWYGIGDAEYILNLQSWKNKRNHLYHVLIRNTILNPLKNLNKFLIFYLIFGFSRMFGFFYYLIVRPEKYLIKS